mgnify:CR=1 FL=1
MRKSMVRKMLASLGVAATTLVAAPAFALVTVSDSLTQSGAFVADDFGLNKGATSLFQRGVVGAQGPLQVTFTAVFSEAAWYNTFTFAGQTLNNKSGLGNSISGVVGAGALDFGFAVEGKSRFLTNAENGSFTEGRPSFAIAALGNGVYLLGLNDDGGSIDDDYDDFVLKMEISQVSVPEPGSLALLGLGVVGIGLTRMKRRKAA